MDCRFLSPTTVGEENFAELNFRAFRHTGDSRGLNIRAYLDSAQNFDHFGFYFIKIGPFLRILDTFSQNEKKIAWNLISRTFI